MLVPLNTNCVQDFQMQRLMSEKNGQEAQAESTSDRYMFFQLKSNTLQKHQCFIKICMGV